MPAHLIRAQLLYQSRRYQDAEQAARAALTDTPNDTAAHRVLALTLYRQERSTEALPEIHTAIALAPDAALNHYTHALILLDLDQDEQSFRAIREAIRLEPNHARHYAVLSSLYLRRKAWSKALQAAEKGLQLEPDNIRCRNLRGTALTNLGRKEEAVATLLDALAQDPNDALTHANQGWTLLHSGDQEEAFTHFREALRLDPTLDWARQGIVEAMKARNPLYRLLLRYFLWMSRLTSDEQIGVLAVSTGIRRALRIAAKAFPPLYLIVLPLMLLHFLFVVLTWIGRPLFALVLRLDRFGRLALPREEIAASNWIGACLLTAVLSAVGAPAFGKLALLLVGLVALAMMIPVAGIFHFRPGRSRLVVLVYTVLLALGGFGAALFALLNTPWGYGVATILGITFGIGWMLYSWLVNILLLLR